MRSNCYVRKGYMFLSPAQYKPFRLLSQAIILTYNYKQITNYCKDSRNRFCSHSPNFISPFKWTTWIAFIINVKRYLFIASIIKINIAFSPPKSHSAELRRNINKQLHIVYMQRLCDNVFIVYKLIRA